MEIVDFIYFILQVAHVSVERVLHLLNISEFLRVYASGAVVK